MWNNNSEKADSIHREMGQLKHYTRRLYIQFEEATHSSLVVASAFSRIFLQDSLELQLIIICIMLLVSRQQLTRVALDIVLAL
jgi:hypothetical protein